MTLEAASRSFGWGAISDYVRHLPVGSATWRALNPEATRYVNQVGLMNIIADLIDATHAVAYAVACIPHSIAGGGKPPRPKPYARRWSRGCGATQQFGRGAIPISEFDEWYYGGDGDGE